MGTAAAEIGIQLANDISGRRVGIFVQERAGCEDHPRRAIAALKGVMIHERFLHRMKHSIRCQSFDGENLLPLDLADGGVA